MLPLSSDTAIPPPKKRRLVLINEDCMNSSQLKGWVYCALLFALNIFAAGLWNELQAQKGPMGSVTKAGGPPIIDDIDPGRQTNDSSGTTGLTDPSDLPADSSRGRIAMANQENGGPTMDRMLHLDCNGILHGLLVPGGATQLLVISMDGTMLQNLTLGNDDANPIRCAASGTVMVIAMDAHGRTILRQKMSLI